MTSPPGSGVEISAAPSAVRAPAAPAAGSPWASNFGREGLNHDRNFIRRVLIVIAFVGLAYFLWSIGRILLLIFAAVLVAVLFHGLANLIARRSPVPERWSLAVAVTLVALLVIGFFALFGTQIFGQTRQVLAQLPEATAALGDRFGVPDLAARLRAAIGAGPGSNILSRVAGIGFTVVGGLADLLIVMVAAIYLAADPNLYRRGTEKLLPESQRTRIDEAFGATGTALRLWSVGQLACMVVVGTMAGLSFWWIGLPAPLALGIIAGVTNFIPFIGPILGSIPALIFAATISTETVIWTAAAVLVIQQIEGNVLMPLIQRRAVSMPPALALFAILVFGVIFGFLGVFLAVPLAVAIMVLVKKLWVRDTLGEETSLPGEADGTAEE